MRKEKYSADENAASKRYSSLKSRVQYDLESSWTRENFIKWYVGQTSRKCCYCGCNEEELKAFYMANESKRKRTRGRSLEIERKEDEPYSERNCELACYWCNNAKSDVFTVKEFEPIGKAIGRAIKARIRKEHTNSNR